MFVMSKEPKLSMRQKLQNCVWIKGEEFSKYYNEKRQLADNLALAKDEFLEYVIDGIHDVNLRNQAKSRSFNTGLELLEAFRNVEFGYVPKPKLPEDRIAGDYQKPRAYIEQDFNDDKSYHLLNYELTQTKNLLDTVILALDR
ncbi:GD24325 [Drosophila simulans]|uniref:GD24325 n=1 Tax=Drosophila simulans TaxID=7240 RepID=B4Q4E7_DROSI|nr:GD24325 [Drosophila simulans]